MGNTDVYCFNPAVYLHHPNGSELEVYLHGANITSWRKPDGEDILFVRPDNSFDGLEPIKWVFAAAILIQPQSFRHCCTSRADIVVHGRKCMYRHGMPVCPAGAASRWCFRSTAAVCCPQMGCCGGCTGPLQPQVLSLACLLCAACLYPHSRHWTGKACCDLAKLLQWLQTCPILPLFHAAGVADPDIAADPAPSVALWTESDEFTMELWPHKFEAMYTVSESSRTFALF